MEEKKKKSIVEEEHEILVRIYGQDIRGSKNIYVGLTKIKGASWTISGIVCKNLNLDKRMKISDLSKDQIKNITEELKNLSAPDFLKNRQRDLDTGESKHFLGVDLDMKREFDIKRMKKIKSYRGIRHSMKLPVRGQRTRSNFRKSGIAVGVKKPRMGKKS